MEAAFYHKGPNIKMEPFWDEKKTLQHGDLHK